MKLHQLSALCVLLGAVSLAHAQSTLGELLDRGARKLTPAEASSAAPLHVVRQSPDSDALMTMHPDGTVRGVVHNKQGHGSSEAVGTWTMDDSGLRCVDVTLPAFNNMYWKTCGYTYRLGEQLYAAPSDSDRAAPVTAYMATAYLKQ